MANKKAKHPKHKQPAASKRRDAPMARAAVSTVVRNVAVTRLPGSSTLGATTGSFKDGQVIFLSKISPATVNTLREQSLTFQKYRFVRVSAVVTSDSPSTNAGLLVAGFIRDPVDKLPPGSAAVDVVDAQPGSARDKVWSSLTVRAGATPWLYTNDSVDPRQSCALQFALVHRGVSTQSTTIEVKLIYEVEFKERTIVPPSSEDEVAAPVIKPGLYLSCKAGHVSLFGAPLGTNPTEAPLNKAVDLFTFDFPQLDPSTANNTVQFRWRMPFPAAGDMGNKAYALRDLVITNTGTDFYVYGTEAGDAVGAYLSDTFSSDNILWIAGDTILPVEGNGVETASLVSSSVSRVGKRQTWQTSRPPLSALSANSALSESYYRNGLIM